MKLVFVCYFLPVILFAKTVTYQSYLEGKPTTVTWCLEEKQESIEVSGKSKESDVQLEYSPSFSLLRYAESGTKNKSLFISKEKNILQIKANTDGKEKKKSLKTGSLPWIQEFKFGLKPFLIDSSKELHFCIVYAKDLTSHEMIALKESEEKITVEGKTYQTQKIKVTLSGFRKKFWKAELWFDKETHLMVKYLSNEGPGTPLTETTLQSIS